MNHRTFVFAAAAVVWFASCPALGGTVISNPGLSLSADDVKQVYSGEMQSKGGAQLAPVENLAEQSNFLAKVMALDLPKYQNHWAKKAFRDGLNAPNSLATDADVIQFVKQNPGGVGYIGGAAPAGVKAVESY